LNVSLSLGKVEIGNTAPASDRRNHGIRGCRLLNSHEPRSADRGKRFVNRRNSVFRLSVWRSGLELCMRSSAGRVRAGRMDRRFRFPLAAAATGRRSSWSSQVQARLAFVARKRNRSLTGTRKSRMVARMIPFYDSKSPISSVPERRRGGRMARQEALRLDTPRPGMFARGRTDDTWSLGDEISDMKFHRGHRVPFPYRGWPASILAQETSAVVGRRT